MQDLRLQPLDATHTDRIVELAYLLNPSVEPETLSQRLSQQWGKDGYHCIGLYRGEDLIGMSSAWVSIRLYGGKLVELDNVIVDPEKRGRGTGSYFIRELEKFFVAEGCQRMELKTYVTNDRSHKFYFNLGFDIRAFYFVKQIAD